MSMQLVLEVRSIPDVLGCLDTMLVIKDNSIRFACPFRAGPNPYKPSTKETWADAYDYIAEGVVSWECLAHRKYGKCLLLNGGGEVPTRNPRPNGDGSIFVGVFAHCAASDTWPGSAGCLTTRPVFWAAFIEMFDVGEKGTLLVRKA